MAESSSPSSTAESISYLTQKEAAEIDELLMGSLGFSVDQLMELAGLSVATAIAELESLSVRFPSVEDLPTVLKDEYDIIVDAMFGFSFRGTPRPPFDDLIQRLVSIKTHDQRHQESPVIVSIDIPSGWHVEEGDISDEGIKPDMLVSLTAPKLCAQKFRGPHHFLGGRFVPPDIMDKFKLRLPPYPGTSMCVRIGMLSQVDKSAARDTQTSPEEQSQTDPFNQFHKWLDDAVKAGLKDPDAMALSTASKDGRPSSRMISLRGVDKNGFTWFTSYRSRKAGELSENPYASLLFYWGALNRQVRVEGFVERVSDEESEQYFYSLQREMQIRPLISQKSTVQYGELEEKYSDGSSISRPKDWGGYRLIPEQFEFWQGEESHVQLKLRFSVEEIDGKRVWKSTQLSPKQAS